jgi:hypothetical protein
MSAQKNLPLYKRQDGQAATEFIIAAAFILVPLLLIVPLLGKYIDIKHAAIEQARFAAWEYTVWAGENETQMTGIDPSKSAGVKKYKKTLEQGLGYFFTDPTSPQYGTSAVRPEINPLWQDQRHTPLLTLENVATEIKEHRTPVPAGRLGQAAETLFQFVGDAISLFGQLLHLVGVDARFDAIYTKGYYTSDVKTSVRSLDQVLPEFPPDKNGVASAAPLVFKAKAGVLSDNWNAAGSKQAMAESRGLVVTSLLSPISTPIDKIIGKLNRLLGKIPLLKIKLPAMPEFGYVKDDLIPYEHLKGNEKKLQSKGGLYSYE